MFKELTYFSSIIDSRHLEELICRAYINLPLLVGTLVEVITRTNPFEKNRPTGEFWLVVSRTGG